MINWQIIKRKISALKNPAIMKLALERLALKASVFYREILKRQPQVFTVGSLKIGRGAPVFIIAEIGVNHEGHLDEAKKLIEAAAAAGANAVKFQKRSLKKTYQEKVVDHPELHDQSLRYLIPILKEVEFGEKDYRELAEHAKKNGLVFIATPFDEESVDFLESIINPPFYKVASADLVNFPLLERLAATGKPLLISTGMATRDEIDKTVLLLNRRNIFYFLLHCQSTYPAAPKTLNLKFMGTMRRRYRRVVGYSGHENGFEPSVLAVGLGAKIIERHITFDQKRLGPDHAASLLPDQFREMVEKIRAAETILGTGVKQVNRGEVMNKIALRKSLAATKKITRGMIIKRDMISATGPGTGVSPQKLYELVGTKAKRNILAGEFFTEADFSNRPESAGGADFKTPWGLKARFFEARQLVNFKPAPNFLEFHVGDKDLDFKFDENDRFPFGLVLHAPEYNNKELMDLASSDNRIWNESIALMQKTINKAREISKHFKGTPKIVIHVGGMSLKKDSDSEKFFKRSVAAFRRLDTEGVEMLPENLPAFGWFFGGLWHINFFVAASQMVRFVKELKLKMCLDLSHAWLYCQASGDDFLKFVEKVTPHVAHLHIADGRGTDKEGLQIGEGDVPFEKAFKILDKFLPDRAKNLSWVPEIWQGHLYDYKEFKIALVKLAKYPFLRG